MSYENVKFKGVMSALVSCIDENENVKENSMRRLMNWHLKEGFSGFYLTGGTGATYNVMPTLFTRIYNSFQASNLADAQEAQFKATRLIEVLLKFGVVVGIKDMLEMIGFDCGYQVYPQKRFTAEEQAAFHAALKELNYEEEYI